MVMEAATDPRLDDADLRIEPMRRRHLRGVVRIEQAVNPRPWTRSLFLSELRYRDSRVYLVALRGRTLVGFAGLMLVAGDGHITNVGVDSDHRRQGIASRLVLELIRQGIDLGAEALTLEVRTSNRGAQELYRRFGFAPAGVRKDYYVRTDDRLDGGREDAIVMWADDVTTPNYRARLREIEAALPPMEAPR